MTDAEVAGVSIALIRLGAAREILDGLPFTTEVRELWRRWVALHIVVLEFLHQRGPVPTESQHARLLDSVRTLAWEVDDLRERLANSSRGGSSVPNNR